METLFLLLHTVLRDFLEIRSILKRPQSIRVNTGKNTIDFWKKMVTKVNEIKEDDLIAIVPPFPFDRYDQYIPENLRRKAYVYNHMDIKGLKEILRL